MTSRGKGGSSSDWDPMREDFNDTNYNAQYLDDSASELVQLDHTKLYITKLPAALGQEGFVDLFSKYGRVVHSYFSRDPLKRYAFVQFETAGEARIAMMKLNKTEPFSMNICFAHLKNPNQQTPSNADRSLSNTDRQANRKQSSVNRQPSSMNRQQSNTDRQHSNTDRQHSNTDRQHSNTDRQHSYVDTQNHNEQRMSTSVQDDCTSISIKGRPRNIEDHVPETDEGEGTGDSDDVGQDPSLEYNLEKIKLQRLQIMDKQLQVQERMLKQQQKMKNNLTVTKRRLLPDGRSIQVTQDNEMNLTAGAGDSRNIPGLQREPSWCCVSCGAAAELFCASCRVTPYCGERCQRRDWEERHRAICHNLARCPKDDVDHPVTNGEPEVPTAAPLRRPHSPAKNAPRESSAKNAPCDSSAKNVPRDSSAKNVPRDSSAKFVPRDSSAKNVPRDSEKKFVPSEKQSAFSQGQKRKFNQVVTGNLSEESGQNRNHGSQNGHTNKDQRPPLRHPAKQQIPEAVIAIHVQPTSPVVETKPEPTRPVASATRFGSLQDVTPRKPLVPASYVIEKLPVGATFLAVAVDKAADVGSKQPGYVCLTLHDEFTEAYNQLCVDFTEQCQKDNEEYTPRIGETFAFLCEEDEGWYRARCLARTRAALLDSGRVLPLSPRASRRLPPSYAAIPEFVAVLTTQDIKVGDNLSCTVVASSSSGIKVTVAEESGTPIGEVQVMRWIPDVEYTVEVPAEPKRPPLRHELKQQNSENRLIKPEQVQPTPQAIKPPKKQIQVVEAIPEPVKATVSSRLVSVRDETPRKPLVPVSILIEKLPVGATFLAEAVGLAADSGSKQPGIVCVTLHQDYGEAYNQLCEEFTFQCQKDKEEYTPSVGETFAFLCDEDEGWYRARCLARTRAALLDSGRVLPLKPRASRRLPPSYAAIPEFVAVLTTQDLKIGDNFSCTVISSSTSGVRVSVVDEAGSPVGEVIATRWLPDVDYPLEPAEISPLASATPTSVGSTSAASLPGVPEVPRRLIEHNAVYVLLDVTSLRRACVRPSDGSAAFDSALQDTVLYGINAKPLKEPPQKGQTVVAKFTGDETHYRAFVKRINVTKNKYLIEYIEYGNEEIVPLERLYPCPAYLQLDAKPPQASIIKLSEREPAALTKAAVTYIDNLKDNAVELVLTIPGGDKFAPSGSLANLLVAKSLEPASKRIEELCTPAWKKLAESGGDVLDTESRFYSDVKYSAVPTSRPFTLRITFCALEMLSNGAVSGYELGDKAADVVYGQLAEQIREYCESTLCRDPYLPKIEELCITKNKRVNKWVRSVLVELPNGPGSKLARVVNIDYGDLELVPVADIRKMLPEFVDQYPALALHFEIKGFPVNASRQQLERGMRFMNVTAAGTGELQVSSCRELEEKIFEVQAPELIAALE